MSYFILKDTVPLGPDLLDPDDVEVTLEFEPGEKIPLKFNDEVIEVFPLPPIPIEKKGCETEYDQDSDEETYRHITLHLVSVAWDEKKKAIVARYSEEPIWDDDVDDQVFMVGVVEHVAP